MYDGLENNRETAGKKHRGGTIPYHTCDMIAYPFFDENLRADFSPEEGKHMLMTQMPVGRFRVRASEESSETLVIGIAHT